MSIKGLDVSRFQGEVDWERCESRRLPVRHAPRRIRGQYCRRTVPRNASECNRIGLPIGAYWFCYAATAENAAKEADSCIRTVSGYRLDYPVCYDIEQASADYVKKLGISFTPALARELVKSFCNRVESKGYFAMFYSNQSFFNAYLGTALAKRYAFWYARYTDTFDGTDCGIWQSTPAPAGCPDQRKCGSGPGLCGLSGRDPQGRAQPPVGNRAGSAGTVPAPQYNYLRDPARRYIERDRAEIRHYRRALAKLNGISDPDKIYAGRTIRVPGKRQFRPGILYHPAGDTLSGIAQNYSTTVSALARLNGISDPDKIYAGDRIRIR